MSAISEVKYTDVDAYYWESQLVVGTIFTSASWMPFATGRKKKQKPSRQCNGDGCDGVGGETSVSNNNNNSVANTGGGGQDGVGGEASRGNNNNNNNNSVANAGGGGRDGSAAKPPVAATTSTTTP